jgi:hypothetical protein
MSDELHEEVFEETELEEVEELVTTEPVDRDSHVALMLERAPTVSVLRVLGAMSLEPKGEVQYFVNGGQVGQDSTINPGDTLYIVGKLAGGR